MPYDRTTDIRIILASAAVGLLIACIFPPRTFTARVWYSIAPWVGAACILTPRLFAAVRRARFPRGERG